MSLAPLAENDVPEGYKSGWEVTVSLKPGLPFGAIHQKIRLKTDLTAARTRDRDSGQRQQRRIVFGKIGCPKAQMLRLDVVKKAGQGIKRTVQLVGRWAASQGGKLSLLSTNARVYQSEARRPDPT